MQDVPDPNHEGMPSVPEEVRQAYSELMRKVSALAGVTSASDVRLVQEALSLAEMLLRTQERRIGLLEARIVYMEPVRPDDPADVKARKQQMFNQGRADVEAIETHLRGFTGAGEAEEALIGILRLLHRLADMVLTMSRVHEDRLHAVERLFGFPRRDGPR